jgi:hypothetical protein
MNKGEKGRMIEWIHDLLYRRSCCVMPLQSLSRFPMTKREVQPTTLLCLFWECFTFILSLPTWFPLFITLFILSSIFFIHPWYHMDGYKWMDKLIGFYGKKEKKKRNTRNDVYIHICIYTWINSFLFYIEKKVSFM